jgi:hypothetical protein
LPTSYHPRDILLGANIGLLSIDLPMLLIALSVLLFQSMGVMMSMVSAGGIVCTHLLILIDRRCRHSVVCMMEILAKDGAEGGVHSLCKHCISRQNHACEENVYSTIV